MFVIPGPPKGKQRPRFGRGVVYTPQQTKDYEKHVAQSFIDSDNTIVSGQIEIEIKAYFAIPKSASLRNYALMYSGKIRPTKKPDIDNIAKIVLDGLNGLAYDDDKQVVDLIVRKYYSDIPRVEVSIKEV